MARSSASSFLLQRFLNEESSFPTDRLAARIASERCSQARTECTDVQSLSAKNVGYIPFNFSPSQKFSGFRLVGVGMGSAPSKRNGHNG